MQDFINTLDINQYLPATVAWATNILLAIIILIFGLWVAQHIAVLVDG
ncbi:MAG: mechanosensitive ion channel family protein, partial [Pseudomonadota bacterium]